MKGQPLQMKDRMIICNTNDSLLIFTIDLFSDMMLNQPCGTGFSYIT